MTKEREPQRNGVFDLSSILADERAVELLRGQSCDPSDLDDRTLTLLASLAKDVRSRELATVGPPPVAVDKVSRRHRLSSRARGTLGGVVVTATLMGLGGGVAAAVTGDPLAGLSGLRTTATAAGMSPEQGNEIRLSNAAREVRVQLSAAEDAARRGDADQARRSLEAAAVVMDGLDGKERRAVNPEVADISAAVGQPVPTPATAGEPARTPEVPTPVTDAPSTEPVDGAQTSPTSLGTPALPPPPAVQPGSESASPTAPADATGTQPSADPSSPTSPGESSSKSTPPDPGDDHESGGSSSSPGTPSSSPSPSTPGGSGSEGSHSGTESSGSGTTGASTGPSAGARPSPTSEASQSASQTGAKLESATTEGEHTSMPAVSVPSSTASATTH